MSDRRQTAHPRNDGGPPRFRPSRVVEAMRRGWKQLRVRTGCTSGLDLLWLELTARCNLGCRHCYVESGPHLPLIEGMETDDWRRTIDDARIMGCKQVQFIGGEPTIHPDFRELLEHARRNRFEHVHIFTNATTLDEEKIAFLERAGVNVAFSFYSCHPEIHDRITGGKGSFERTVEAISLLVEHRVSHEASIIVMEENVAHLEETKRFLKGLGVSSIGTDRVRGIGRGADLVPADSPWSELCGSCWRGTLCIDPQGRAFPCVFSRFYPVGNVRTDSLREIVEGARLQAFRRDIYLGARETPSPARGRLATT